MSDLLAHLRLGIFSRLKPGWLGLNLKLTALIVLVSAVGVLASSVLILTLQRQQLEQNALQSTTRLSTAINASLEQAMLYNDRQMMSEIIRTVVDKQTVEHIRILDATGTVHFSSIESDIGLRLDYSHAACQSCHVNTARPSNQSAIIQTPDQHAAMLNVNLIYNQPVCYNCHLPQQKILGLTVTESALGDLNKQIESGFQRIVVSALVTFGMLIVLMLFALRRMILKPIGELIVGMTEVRDGNLDYTLPTSSADEFAQVASAFDNMRQQLRVTRNENVALNKKVRSIAILEERDRLARELHDCLAQMLGFISIKASLAGEQLAQGQDAQVHSSLAELKQVAKEAYTDVRESIFYLRSPASKPDALITHLKEYVAEYRSRYGIQTELWIEDERLTEFPDEVQVQIDRIVQEALTNVRKHARANRACVRFGRRDHHVCIQIEDNGVGFDPASLHQDGAKHFGLQIMQERAESVGGEFQVDSQLGLGTKVILQVPRMPLIEDPNENVADFVS